MGSCRLLMILALLPMAATNGVPHVACRCSNGEIRWYCPKLNVQQSQNSVVASKCCQSSKTAARKSCCGGNQGDSRGNSSSRHTKNEGESCCADACKCTPCVITSDVGPTLAKVSIPDLQIHFANITDVTERLVRVDRSDVARVESHSDKPIDLIVLFERFLI